MFLSTEASSGTWQINSVSIGIDFADVQS